jgi:hypothetical protein
MKLPLRNGMPLPFIVLKIQRAFVILQPLLNRVRVVDIVYELRTNGLPIPEDFIILLQKVFLKSWPLSGCCVRGSASSASRWKTEGPDPYTLMLSGSVGFLFFSGSYYVSLDRLSTILYAITIPFDMMIAWGESWMKQEAFQTDNVSFSYRTSLCPAWTHSTYCQKYAQSLKYVLRNKCRQCLRLDQSKWKPFEIKSVQSGAFRTLIEALKRLWRYGKPQVRQPGYKDYGCGWDSTQLLVYLKLQQIAFRELLLS